MRTDTDGDLAFDWKVGREEEGEQVKYWKGDYQGMDKRRVRRRISTRACHLLESMLHIEVSGTRM
jgi:hypothetical protein